MFVVFYGIVVLVNGNLVLLSGTQGLVIERFLPPGFRSCCCACLVRGGRRGRRVGVSCGFVG